MAYCEKHKVEFDKYLWCPGCLHDEVEKQLEEEDEQREIERHQPREAL